MSVLPVYPNKNKNLKVMKKNMGSIDRTLRLLAAAVFVVLYLTKVVTGTWGIVMLAIAFMFAATSFFSFCPLYLPFGISTCRKSKR
jgi:hypothetical protein